MSKSKGHIEVYLRLRPTNKYSREVELDEENKKVQFTMEKDPAQGYVNNQDALHSFQFDKVFDHPTKQDYIFEEVAKDVVDNCMDGYNGTIFAYGQTGSGKTFTITGGAERYVDRGIIPRSISYIFKQMNERTHTSYRLNISYMEIYNNVGYDLLDENHATKNLYDLKKIMLYENENEQFVMKNLSVHRADNEEDALNLLFIGDTNRVVSETPKNDASTRSHCIFILQMEAQKYGEDVKTVSKLHLVDLSGSERAGKNGAEGQQFKEAVCINSSLHFLQQVIVCLNKKSKGEQTYIPYRNSMMTMVLRDSIGGNCKTKMIANISADPEDVYESLSTCRFAKRVSKIRNDASKNEVVDPALIIQRLKKEISELKTELTLLKGGSHRDHLEPEEIDKCDKMVEEFIENKDPSATLMLPDKIQINQCFYHFKHLFLDLRKKKQISSSEPSQMKGGTKPQVLSSPLKGGGGEIENSSLTEEMERYKMLLKQRDNEIVILVNLLNKKKATEGVSIHRFEERKDGESLPYESSNPLETNANTINTQSSSYKSSFSNHSGYEGTNPKLEILQHSLDEEYQPRGKSMMKNGTPLKSMRKIVGGDVNDMLTGPIQIKNEDLLDRSKSFEVFRKSYRKNQAMEENKALLKEKYLLGKKYGMEVNNTRNMMKQLTNQIEQVRRENAMRGMVTDDNEVIKTHEEKELHKKIGTFKQIYSEQYKQLKELKSDIERIQNLLERSRERMQKDFEQWLGYMLKQYQITNSSQHQSQKAQNLMKASINTSISNTSHIQDENVINNMAAFYKARDQIYTKLDQ